MGKEQIQQLVSIAIDKYEKETGEKVVRNQNPDNYKGLANKLSDISNRLPIDFPKEFKPDNKGKYDITTAQIRDALFGKVERLKVHFNEALHLYIYGKRSAEVNHKKGPDLEPTINPNNQQKLIRQRSALLTISAILFIATLFFVFKWITAKHQFEYTGHQLDATQYHFDSAKKYFETIKRDIRILPYKPNKVQIESIEGVYLVYTGSPQVRKSDPRRWHMVVPGIVQIDYNKGGYFTFYRYGPKINQDGWMQFEDSNIISLHSNYVDPLTKKRSVPKMGLMQLEKSKETFNAISTSWTWDSNPKYNVIIGIREVFIKLGKVGEIKDVTNTLHYRNLEGTILHWKNDKIDTIIQLQNVRLETLPEVIQPLLDENSIILKDLDDSAFAPNPDKRATVKNKSKSGY